MEFESRGPACPRLRSARQKKQIKTETKLKDIKKYKLKKNNNHTRPGSGPLRLVLRANPPGEYKI